MLETALEEIDIIGTAHLNGCFGASEPTLIVKFVILITLHLRLYLISIGHIHTGLEGYVTHERGTHPCSVLEAYVLEANILNRTVERSLNIDQCLHSRNYSLGHSLALTGIIVELACIDIVIPFPGLIEQLAGVGEVEC